MSRAADIAAWVALAGVVIPAIWRVVAAFRGRRMAGRLTAFGQDVAERAALTARLKDCVATHREVSAAARQIAAEVSRRETLRQTG